MAPMAPIDRKRRSFKFQGFKILLLVITIKLLIIMHLIFTTMLDDGNYSSNDFEMISRDKQSTFIQKIPTTIRTTFSQPFIKINNQPNKRMEEIQNFITKLREEFQNKNPCSNTITSIGNPPPSSHENDFVQSTIASHATLLLATSPNNYPLVNLVEEFFQIMTLYQYETVSEIDFWKLYHNENNNNHYDQNQNIERKLQAPTQNAVENNNNENNNENNDEIQREDRKERLEKTKLFHTTFPYENGIDIQQFRNENNLPNDKTNIILLICNPLQSIFQSFLLSSQEEEQEEQWTQWRDNNFIEMLESWTRHIEYWMDLQMHENPLVISHEQLIGSNSGIATLLQFHQYMISTMLDTNNLQPLPQPQPQPQISFEKSLLDSSSSIFSLTKSMDVGCIWNHLFKNEDTLSFHTIQPFYYDDNIGMMPSLLNKYSFTNSQMKQALNAIIQLKTQYSFISDLTNIFKSYMQLIDTVIYIVHPNDER